MNKIFGTILTAIFLLTWLLLLLIFHVVQVIARCVFGARPHQRSVDLMNFCLMHALWILGTRSSVRFAEPLSQGRPIIFVANHQNKIDVVGIGWYLRRYSPKFVSKIELGKGIPSVSYNLRHSGAALIDRDDARQSLREIGRLGKLIEDTCASAVIFPEGTRSLTGEMRPFAAAGIKILIKKSPSALVVPIYIHNTWKLNQRRTFRMSLGSRIDWTVLPAIETRDKTPDEAAQLAEQSVRREFMARTGAA
ncbi:MAG: lysophospholipid acyltransferase family protein [Stenotrophobium sp.]